MLKETRREKGCLSGCLMSFAVGGVLGVVVTYAAAGYFMHAGSKEDQQLYLLLRWGYSAAGFFAGTVIWAIFHWVYVRFFMKSEEEDAI